MIRELVEQTTLRIRARLSLDDQFEPVGSETSDSESFCDHDLAFFVESRFGEAVDPSHFDDASRRAWIQKAVPDEELARPGAYGTQCYWLRNGERRVGTIAWWPMADSRGATTHVSSLYVAPAYRRLGHARRALLALRDAAFAEEVRQVGLEASWYSQPALRFYCSLGMWLRHWKRDLSFVFAPDLPSWRLELEGDLVRFFVGDEAQPVVHAERRGERLVWTETPALHARAQRFAPWEVPGTVAVALAIEGWPLLRSEAQWQEQLGRGFSDCGGPEGLAFKIRHYEAWAKKNGWRVNTPTIPGLDYPAWDDLP